MSLTPSNMMALGTQAPNFTLLEPKTGKDVSLNQAQGNKATVVAFICNHCPYVIHIADKLSALAQNYQAQGVKFIAINSNDVDNYPADSPDKMIDFAKQYDFTFPYLYDATQEVAKAYDAACTPDFFVFGDQLKCAYRGRFDAATPGNNQPVTGSDLAAALDNILANQPVGNQQRPSMGCNIKWRNN